MVVVLHRGFGKGTITLDVFGSQETERKNQKRRMRFKNIYIFFLLFTVRNNNFFKIFDVKK